MPSKKTKASPEGNVPVSQDKSGLGGVTMEELRRITSGAIDNCFDKLMNNLDRVSELNGRLLRTTDQRLAGLAYEGRQPRLAMEADITPDTKTRKRTEDAPANRAKHGDSSSARMADVGSTSLANFGKIAEPPLAPEKCISNALADKGAEVPKASSSTCRVRILPSAAGGLLPTGTASTATRTIFHQPPL